jgi:hypothetical protein
MDKRVQYLLRPEEGRQAFANEADGRDGVDGFGCRPS